MTQAQELIYRFGHAFPADLDAQCAVGKSHPVSDFIDALPNDRLSLRSKLNALVRVRGPGSD